MNIITGRPILKHAFLYTNSPLRLANHHFHSPPSLRPTPSFPFVAIIPQTPITQNPTSPSASPLLRRLPKVLRTSPLHRRRRTGTIPTDTISRAVMAYTRITRGPLIRRRSHEPPSRRPASIIPFQATHILRGRHPRVEPREQVLVVIVYVLRSDEVL